MVLTLALALALLGGCPPTGDTADTADTGDTSDTDTADTAAPTERWFRVATWNVATLGSQGDPEYEAAKRILGRIDADVVALNEIGTDADVHNLADLADELGYASVVVPSYNPFGTLRNAIISKRAPTGSAWPDSAELSGDLSANDVTRLPVLVEHAITGVGTLTVVTQHWKSGWFDDDEFRRMVDSRRTVQAAARGNPQTSWVLISGDVNAEVDGPAETPTRFHSLPSSMPGGYFLGEDLYDEMTSGGLVNDAFQPLYDGGYDVVDMTQRDGTTATRPESGRRLDYIFASAGAPSGWRAEIFDCNDQSLPGLPMAGDPITASSCRLASDHLPLVIDLPLP